MNGPEPEYPVSGKVIGEISRKPGRRRVYESVAARSRAKRERDSLILDEVDALIDALSYAFERGRCEPFLDNLPEERRAKLREVTRRVEGKKLIACEREDKPK